MHDGDSTHRDENFTCSKLPMTWFISPFLRNRKCYESRSLSLASPALKFAKAGEKKTEVGRMARYSC